MAFKRFREKQIKDLMKPVSEYSEYEALEGSKIHEVASQVQKNRYHMVPVVNNKKIPVGLVTQTDLINKIISDKALDTSKEVENVMNKDFIRVIEDMTVDAALALMNSMKINKLVVIASDGSFKGIQHKSDVIRAAQELL